MCNRHDVDATLESASTCKDWSVSSSSTTPVTTFLRMELATNSSDTFTNPCIFKKGLFAWIFKIISCIISFLLPHIFVTLFITSPKLQMHPNYGVSTNNDLQTMISKQLTNASQLWCVNSLSLSHSRISIEIEKYTKFVI